LNAKVNIPAEQVRRLLEEYLEPLTEDGTLDSLFKAFVDELTPYASAAARRAFERCFARRNAEDAIVSMRVFMLGLSDHLQRVLRDEKVSLTYEHVRLLDRATIDLKNWVAFLDRWPADPLEPSVPPAADIILAGGGAP